MRIAAGRAGSFEAGAELLRPPSSWAQAPGKKPEHLEPLDITAQCRPRSPETLATEADLDTRVQDVYRFLSKANKTRINAFFAAASALATDAPSLEMDTLGTIIEKAIGSAAGTMCSRLLALVPGIPGVLAGIIQAGFALAGATVGASARTAKGHELDVSDFLTSAAIRVDEADAEFERAWSSQAVKRALETCADPATVANDLVRACSNAQAMAFGEQYASTFAAWCAHVHGVAGAGSKKGILTIHADIQAGGYEIRSADLPGIGPSILDGVNAVSGSDKCNTITLRQLIADARGLSVRVVDSAGEVYEYDSVAQEITTGDNHLLIHHVNRYGMSKWHCQAPVVNAHRFLFEILGTRTLADLGVKQ